MWKAIAWNRQKRKLYKDFLPDYNGGQPPNPRSLTHYGPKYESKKRKAVHKKYGPSYFGHLLGAQVALQHSLILRKDGLKKHN